MAEDDKGLFKWLSYIVSFHLFKKPKHFLKLVIRTSLAFALYQAYQLTQKRQKFCQDE